MTLVELGLHQGIDLAYAGDEESGGRRAISADTYQERVDAAREQAQDLGGAAMRAFRNNMRRRGGGRGRRR